jgi:hypothetical protein
MSIATYKRLYELSKTAARRFSRMSGAALVAADAGLSRYFSAIDKFGLDAELTTIREILDTASDRKFGKRQATKTA